MGRVNVLFHLRGFVSDETWLRRARESYLDRGESEPRSLELLPPHASSRRYARVMKADGSTEIGMLFPEDSGPEEAGGPVGEGVEDSAFVRAQRWLSAGGVPVPELYAFDEAQRVLWLEDVGHTDLDAHVAEKALLAPAYHRALDVLQQFQAATEEDVPDEVAGRAFDEALLRWELAHYVEWRLEADLGLSLSADQRAELDGHFDALAAKIAAMPACVIHRDLQSHNIMVQPERLVLLDFQDAMIGPYVYDAVALLRDSYVSLPTPLLGELIERFARFAADTHRDGDVAGVIEDVHLQTVQRKLKDAGRFVFIDRVKGNPDFLQYRETSLRYVAEALKQLPQLQPLARLLRALDPWVVE
ncbi:MAG: aminoglycoside/choline kinase family phosphotransferase [Bradymonadia bacterium]|jgi:aminoglycoside/choline kinase family phosphotransferase